MNIRTPDLAATALILLLALDALAGEKPTQADLVFPSEAKELSFFSGLGVGIWKPSGPGPFPAIILVHTCGGLTEHIGYWRKQAINRGYVAFIIDAFSSRGSANCRPRVPISMWRGVKDVLDATEHLRSLPFVIPDQIAVFGFSWGGMAGLLSASPGYVAELPTKALPPSAIVSFYAACYIGPFGDYPGNEYLREDLAAPTLVLMGETDNETPPSECVPRLEQLIKRNAPVEWKIFGDAGHSWDRTETHNVRRSPPWAKGQSVVYRYNEEVTDESTQAAFRFLAKQFDAKK